MNTNDELKQILNEIQMKKFKKELVNFLLQIAFIVGVCILFAITFKAINP